MAFNLFGQSLGDFGSRIGGLLTDQEQQMALTNNPMFNVGMGILGSQGNPNQNAFQGAMAGLASAKKQAQSDEDRQRMQELREKLGELIGQQQQGGGVAAAPPPTVPSIDPASVGMGGAQAQMPTQMPNPLADPAQLDAQLAEQAREALRQQGIMRPTDRDMEMMLSMLKAQGGI